MSYTQGEWKHIEDGVIVAEDGKQIASVFPRDRKANTHLMAAAPEMYEACKAMIARLAGWGSESPHAEVSQMKQALAKAEGKEG